MGRLVEPKKKDRAVEEFARIDSPHPLANCKPRGDRVVVQRDEKKKQTQGGILLVDSGRTRVPTGRVVRLGPGKRDDSGKLVPLDLKLGDRVILTSYAGMEINDAAMTRSEEDEFVMLREDDILAVIPE